jgi:hypothetical protein
MQELKEKIVSTKEHVEEYLKVEEQLLRLRVVRSSSKALAVGFSMVVLIVTGFIAMIFLSIGAAELINQAAGNDYLGHLIIGGCYLLLGLVIWFGRKKFVLDMISNKLIHAILEEPNEKSYEHKD